MIKDVRIALGGVVHKLWRAEHAEAPLRRGPATEAAFRQAAEADLAAAQPLRDNAFKIDLAKWVTAGFQAATPARRCTISTASSAPLSRELTARSRCRGRPHSARSFPREGLTCAALQCSTITRGRIAVIETGVAETAPGVIMVMTHRNAPKPKAAGPDDLTIMQDDRVHWNGQPVAIVLAETQEQAEHAQSLISWSPTPSCALLARRWACSGSNPPWMSSLLNLGQTRSSCASAMNPTRAPPRDRPSPSAGSSRPDVMGPSGSAGTSAAQCQ